MRSATGFSMFICSFVDEETVVLSLEVQSNVTVTRSH
jgi:hypothetical protein